MVYSAKSDAAGTISQFTRRKKITITTGGTSTPALYQVLLDDLAYEPEMQASFQDIRFNTKAGAYIDYWIESHVDSTSADVWIELPDAITDPGGDYIWMYYGNTGLSDGSNIENTFVFGDDFNRADSADMGSGWTTYGSVVFEILNNTAHRKAGAVATANQMALATSLGVVTDIIVESKIYIVDTYDVLQAHLGITVRSNTEGDGTHRGYSLVTNNAITALSLLDEHVAWKASTTTTQALNEWWNWKLQVDGNNMRGKAWKVGTSEPSPWSVQDTSTTQASGYVGLDSTMYDIEAYWDDFRVRKYIANEPTPSYGTAQHQRRTPQFL